MEVKKTNHVSEIAANFFSSASFKELLECKLATGGGVEAGAAGDGSGASEYLRVWS